MNKSPAMPRHAARYLDRQSMPAERPTQFHIRVLRVLDRFVWQPFFLTIGVLLLLVLFAFQECAALVDRINFRRLDRQLTFACGWGLCLVGLYLILVVLEAHLRGNL